MNILVPQARIYTNIDETPTLVPQADGSIKVDSRRHCPECLRPLAAVDIGSDERFCWRGQNADICCHLSPYDPESIRLFGAPGDPDFPRDMLEVYYHMQNGMKHD